MTIVPRRPNHMLRFGIHAEKDYFVDGDRLYDTAVFNATSVEYTTKSVASLLVGPLAEKEYFIDPNTHAFGQDVEHVKGQPKEEGGEPRTKKSIENLAQYYGTPVAEIVGRRPVEVSDFLDAQVTEAFVSRVLQFQEARLESGLADDAKYLENERLRPPQLLVAPYLYMDGNNVQDLLKLNIALGEVAVGLARQLPLFSELVIGADLLDNNLALGEVVTAYTSLKGTSGTLLWISDFGEHQENTQRLKAYRALVSGLAADGRPVLSLYGGFFSALLLHFGLAGVCHGPGYGEERDVVPLGGGMPLLKFYLTPVHQRLPFADVELIRAGGAWPSPIEYFDEVCSGAVCRSVIGDDLSNFRHFGTTEPRTNVRGRIYDAITPETRYRLTMHFMEAKAIEIQNVVDRSLGDLRSELLAAKSKYGKVLQTTSFDYLTRWAEALAD